MLKIRTTDWLYLFPVLVSTNDRGLTNMYYLIIMQQNCTVPSSVVWGDNEKTTRPGKKKLVKSIRSFGPTRTFAARFEAAKT